jgi:hypothetical protein
MSAFWRDLAESGLRPYKNRELNIVSPDFFGYEEKIMERKFLDHHFADGLCDRVFL